MPRVVISSIADEADLAALRTPRHDLLDEVDEGEGRFGCGSGPFRHYERRVEARPRADGGWDVTEQTDFELSFPGWGLLFVPVIKRAIRHRSRTFPWWAPPARMDARAAKVLGLLCTASLISGYLGTLITQTITFAAGDFGASKAAQGGTLAGVRVGVLLSLWLAVLADRRGRRQMLLVSALGGCLAAAAGALSPNLLALGVTQTVSRAFATALALLIAVVAAEEMPAGARAYAAGVLAMTAGLGAGIALWVLPVADLGPGWWRVLYVVPLLALPLVRVLARGLPESRRFVRRPADAVRRTMAGHRRRLTLLSATAFLGTMFLAPASQFQNEFLRDEHHFSAAGITLFTLLTSTPGGIGIVVGGRLADVRGRRGVGAIGAAGGAILTVVAFQVGGPALWITSLLGVVLAAMTIPALGVYGPELFPTALRSRANGIITLVAVVGSGVGLLAAGAMADHFGRFGPGMAVLGIGPLLMAVLVLLWYPETAHRELEELNPEDAATLALVHPLD